jgi:hypothetical protein
MHDRGGCRAPIGPLDRSCSGLAVEESCKSGGPAGCGVAQYPRTGRGCRSVGVGAGCGRSAGQCLHSQVGNGSCGGGRAGSLRARSVRQRRASEARESGAGGLNGDLAALVSS